LRAAPRFIFKVKNQPKIIIRKNKIIYNFFRLNINGGELGGERERKRDGAPELAIS
jgi:hypothetical protein